mmetsp:Transcript_32762/g.92945  ORF Transcript_32762/g.92945 Transcript_32762/m.92945 type:complete len:175 (-) Transcript_32762:424-948(-)
MSGTQGLRRCSSILNKRNAILDVLGSTYLEAGRYHQMGTGRPFSGTAYRATTVLCVRKDNEVVIMADGQVTMGSQVVKPNVNKVRRINDAVIGGFAGTTTDAITLFERLESRLEEHPGQLKRAAVELAKAWRTDKYLRRLDVGRYLVLQYRPPATSANNCFLTPEIADFTLHCF